MCVLYASSDSYNINAARLGNLKPSRCCWSPIPISPNSMTSGQRSWELWFNSTWRATSSLSLNYLFIYSICTPASAKQAPRVAYIKSKHHHMLTCSPAKGFKRRAALIFGQCPHQATPTLRERSYNLHASSCQRCTTIQTFNLRMDHFISPYQPKCPDLKSGGAGVCIQQNYHELREGRNQSMTRFKGLNISKNIAV